MDAQHYYQYQVFRHQLTKLQAYKSSFQAWKCVSFGYALLATVLLSAKWHEVSTDLKLLHGIDQLLWQTSTNSSHFANNSIQLNTTRTSSITSELDDGDGQLDGPRLGETQWSPAVALAELLAVNATGGGVGETANSSSAVLMSHMQLSLGRELNGNQLLKQEVEAFLAEFRSAKSTLSLSSLLVFVYIISWILMTLAVNDTRISNDVSLRNILLLSVFGAIDMAASVGFIMVRLIMYNFKSNTFVAEILGSATLRNSPIRLSPDQLTAFTALRLIAMRSCSAYVDAYVSVLVALLTILRLYAIVRAIAYYRFLRRFNDLSRNLHHHHQLTSAIMNQTSEKQHLHAQMSHQHNNQNHHQATTLQGYISQSGAGVDLMRPPSHQWPASQQQDANGPTTTSTGLAFSPNANNNKQGRQHEQQLLSPNRMQAAQLVDQKQQQQQQQQMILNEAIRFNAGATFYGDQMRFGPDKLHQLQMADLMGAKSPANLSVRTTDDQQLNKTLIKVASFGVQQQQARHTISNRHTTSNQRAALLVATVNDNDQMVGQPVSNKFHRDNNNNNNNLSSGAPNVLMVNGQPHRLIATSAAASELDARRKRHQFTGYESSGGFESEPVGVAEQRRQHLERRSRQRARSRDERLLLASAAGRIQQQTSGRQLDQNEAGQRPKQEQPSFTLLSASQLDRLSRKLLANATGSLALGQSQTRGRHLQQQHVAGRAQLGPGDSATLGGNRYKLIARYRPLKRPAASELDARQNRQQVDGTRLASQLIVQDDDEDEDDDELVPAATTLRGANKRRLAALLDDTSTSGNGGGGGGGSSSGLATDSDDAPTATPPDETTHLEPFESSGGRRQQLANKLVARQSDRQRSISGGGSRRHRTKVAALASLRQTEELSLEPSATLDANRDLLLGKYYYA